MLHDRPKIRVLHTSIIGKNLMHNTLEPKCANLVIKTIKLYIKCGIIVVVIGIILSIIARQWPVIHIYQDLLWLPAIGYR